MNIMGWGEQQGPKTSDADPLRSITEAERDEHRSEPQPRAADGSLIPTPDAVDPDTALDGAPFVSDAKAAENPGPSVAHPWPTPDPEIVDVFAVVAAYDHEVGNQTAPEFDTYEHAQDAGIALLLTNANVLHFRIEKRTRIQ